MVTDINRIIEEFIEIDLHRFMIHLHGYLVDNRIFYSLDIHPKISFIRLFIGIQNDQIIVLVVGFISDKFGCLKISVNGRKKSAPC